MKYRNFNKNLNKWHRLIGLYFRKERQCRERNISKSRYFGKLKNAAENIFEAYLNNYIWYCQRKEK